MAIGLKPFSILRNMCRSLWSLLKHTTVIVFHSTNFIGLCLSLWLSRPKLSHPPGCQQLASKSCFQTGFIWSWKWRWSDLPLPGFVRNFPAAPSRWSGLFATLHSTVVLICEGRTASCQNDRPQRGSTDSGFYLASGKDIPSLIVPYDLQYFLFLFIDWIFLKFLWLFELKFQYLALRKSMFWIFLS